MSKFDNKEIKRQNTTEEVIREGQRAKKETTDDKTSQEKILPTEFEEQLMELMFFVTKLEAENKTLGDKDKELREQNKKDFDTIREIVKSENWGKVEEQKREKIEKLFRVLEEIEEKITKSKIKTNNKEGGNKDM